MKLFAIAAAAALFASPAAAVVLTYDVSFPTSGTPSTAMINFTVDFDAVSTDAAPSTAGLTINSKNFDVDGQILGAFISPSLLQVGSTGGVNSIDNDFLIGIVDPKSPGSASIEQVVLAQTGPGTIAFADAGTLSVSQVNAIPLPAGLPLLAGALGALALLRRPRRIAPALSAC